MPQCGDIFYTLEPARRVTPKAMSPLVQIAPSSFHCFYTSASISNPVKTEPNTNRKLFRRTSIPNTKHQPPNLSRQARILNAPTLFHRQNQPHSRNGVPDQQNTPEGAGPADRRQLGRAEIRRDERGQVRGRNRSGHYTVSGVVACWRCFGKKETASEDFVLLSLGTIADRFATTGQA